MQSAINGPHPRQTQRTTSTDELSGQLRGHSRHEDRLRPEPGLGGSRTDVRRNTEQALKLLESQGAILEEVALAWDFEHIRAALQKALLSTGMGEILQQIKDKGGSEDALTSYGRHFMKALDVDAGPRQLGEAQRYADELFKQYDALFDNGFQAFVCPTVTTTRVPADFDFTASKLLVDGKEVDPFAGWVLTPQFNLIYTIPVVNVPTGLADNRVPTGMQVAARSFDDLTAFRVASAYAAAAAPRLFTGDLMLPGLP